MCLNPAWQKVLTFPRLSVGTVNRADTLCECGGGKGINLARAVRIQGSADIDVALFRGGYTGERLARELAAAGIGEIAVETPDSTRTCITVCDCATSTVTELIEPSSPVPPTAVTIMRRRLDAAIPDYRAVAICGTFPPGTDASIYAEIATRARAAGAVVLLDGFRDVQACLETGIDILKINADELRTLTRRPNLGDALMVCLNTWPVNWLAVTDGPHHAYLADRRECWRFRIPEISGVRNCIGAGDCTSGILLTEYLQTADSGDAGTVSDDFSNRGMCMAFRRALASASASCRTDRPGVFDPRDAAGIAAEIVISPVDRSRIGELH